MSDLGVFISIEGIDGCGKSTVIYQMKKYLEECGKDVVTVRCPGGTELGEELRNIVLTKTMSGITELLLFLAIRSELSKTVIEPALERGSVVISDRYIDSTMAYQGYGKGLMPTVNKLLDIDELAHMPDYTLYLDIPFDVSLDRVNNRVGNNVNDKFEASCIDFKRKVYAGYKLTIYNNERVHVIDASGNYEEVWINIKKWLDSHILNNHPILMT